MIESIEPRSRFAPPPVSNSVIVASELPAIRLTLCATDGCQFSNAAMKAGQVKGLASRT
jgi:hypothetical protein